MWTLLAAVHSSLGAEAGFWSQLRATLDLEPVRVLALVYAASSTAYGLWMIVRAARVLRNTNGALQAAETNQRYQVGRRRDPRRSAWLWLGTGVFEIAMSIGVALVVLIV